MSKRSEARPRSGRAERSDLCGFEGAKPGARARRADRKAEGEAGSREEEAEAQEREAGTQKISGDNSLRDPPVPIPNTEVKPQHADSTWLETAR